MLTCERYFDEIECWTMGKFLSNSNAFDLTFLFFLAKFFFFFFFFLTQSITYDFYFIHHNVAHGAIYSAVKNVKSFRAPFKTPFKRRLIMPINFRSKRRLKFNSKLSLKRSCKRSSKHISKRNSQHVKNTNKLLLDWKIINLLCQKLSIRVLKIKTSLKKKRLSWWTHGFGSNKIILCSFSLNFLREIWQPRSFKVVHE